MHKMRKILSITVTAAALAAFMLATLAACSPLSTGDVPHGYAKVRVAAPSGRAITDEERQNSRMEYYFNDRKSDSNETIAQVGSVLRIKVVAIDARNGRQVATAEKTITVALGMNNVSVLLHEDRGAQPTPPPPSPTIEYVNITFNQGFVYTNSLHQPSRTWIAMTGATLPNSGQREKGSTVSADQATAAGYVFKGWVADSGMPSGGAPDAQNFNYVHTYTESATLYAIWEQLEPGSHEVKFETGAGSDSVLSMPVNTQKQSTTQVTWTETPTRAGYEFTGWNASVSGVSVTQQGNSWTFMMPDSPVTLTAQWQLKTYTIKFDGGIGGGTQSDISFTVTDTSKTLPSTTTFTAPSGKSFRHWATQADGVSVTLEYIIAQIKIGNTNSFTMNGNEITVYAVWQNINYKIVYNGNSNTGGTVPSQVTYTVTNNNVQLADVGNLVRTNYKFLGWNTTNNATTALPQLSFAELQNHQNLQSTDANNKTLTLYAVWERVYTLTLNLNGGNWADASDNKTQYGASDLPLTLPTPNPPSTLTGYVFAGWIDKDNNYGLVGTDGMAIPSGTTGNKTYYAVYHTTSAGNKADTTNTGGIEFVAVQGGTVPLAADYMPVVSNFSMSKTEITQAQWKAVMGGNLPSDMATTTDTADNNPVNQVSWFDAIAFCNKLSLLENKTPCYSVTVNGQEVDWKNLQYSAIPKSANDDWRNASCDFTQNGYRLPTEAEWEYAARGGIHHSAFTYSGSDTVGDVVWYEINSDSKTHEVRDSSKQANVLVIYDMSGNVCEWCWDSYVSPYDKSRGDDPTGGDSSTRVLRGGSWKKTESNCKVSYRGYEFTSTRADYFGLRIVCRP